MSSIDDSDWNKRDRLDEQRRAAQKAEPPPRLQPPFPWVAIPYDPAHFPPGDRGGDESADPSAD